MSTKLTVRADLDFILYDASGEVVFEAICVGGDEGETLFRLGVVVSIEEGQFAVFKRIDRKFVNKVFSCGDDRRNELARQLHGITAFDEALKVLAAF